jgi:hypothetical protein
MHGYVDIRCVTFQPKTDHAAQFAVEIQPLAEKLYVSAKNEIATHSAIEKVKLVVVKPHVRTGTSDLVSLVVGPIRRVATQPNTAHIRVMSEYAQHIILGPAGRGANQPDDAADEIKERPRVIASPMILEVTRHD